MPLEKPQPYERRIEPLLRLNFDTIFLPNGDIKPEVISYFMRGKEIDKKYGKNSRFIPPVGVEVETTRSKYPNSRFPYEEIARVTKAGIPKDPSDSFPAVPQKYEAALKPTTSYRVILLEMMELYKRSIIIPKKRRFYESSEYYPIHITIGNIQRDFPHSFTRDETELASERAEEEMRPEKLSLTLEDWVDASPKSEVILNRESKWKRQYPFSDVFILARMLDSTLYSTSPERLTQPFSKALGYNQERFNALRTSYIQKGYSGVTEREREKDPDLIAIEFRTSELWGKDSFYGLARTIITGQILSSALIAYQQLPMEWRDKIIFLESQQNFDAVTTFMNQTDYFKDETSRELAKAWLQLRREFLALSEKYEVPDPANAYFKDEFRAFAAILDEEDHKRKTKNSENYISESRKLLIKYRRVIKNVLLTK